MQRTAVVAGLFFVSICVTSSVFAATPIHQIPLAPQAMSLARQPRALLASAGWRGLASGDGRR